MLVLLEILIFAALSGYLFYRLWTILGTKVEMEGDNINAENPDIYSFGIEPSEEQGPLQNREISPEAADKVLLLQEKIPLFTTNSFLDKAEKAFPFILKAYAEGDKKTLKALLSVDVYKQFSQSIKEREERLEKIEIDVKNIRKMTIQNIKIENQSISLTVEFISEQMFATYNQEGLIFDNPAKLYLDITDIWTFTKDLGTETPVWLLSETRLG